MFTLIWGSISIIGGLIGGYVIYRRAKANRGEIRKYYESKEEKGSKQ